MTASWFVVSNEVGTILAVYGAALQAEARQKATDIYVDHGCPVALHVVTGNRPRVFGSISMKGSVEWFGKIKEMSR